ncbi:DUF1189 domain-containing protein [Halalkalibacterium ligniniphilum]|uniref:DUF1189 domain-containing protein n=1 Tax=Halalkalibacterium ligniniphilum TaxID=1134413 RepID=UPI00034DB346|nr:DUF1189 domain-containing protein [Halalkalibacterium ligniniphilum]
MNVFQLFLKSLYSPKIIAYGRLQRITKAITHVLLTILIATLPSGIAFVSTLHAGVSQLQSALIADIPTFQIENGQLSVPIETAPYINDQIIDGVFILDGTGTIQNDDLASYGSGVALLEREAVIFNHGESQTISYGLVLSQEISNDTLLEVIEQFMGIFPLLAGLAILIMYIGLAGASYLGISLLAMIGLMLKKRATRLSYGQLWAMAAFSITLPAISFAIIDPFFISVPFFFLILGSILMLFLAIRSIPKPKTQTKGHK